MTRKLILIIGLAAMLAAGPAFAERFLLVPMDLTQTNHLRAYGVAFHSLQAGEKVNWLLNYRGGSFVMPDSERLRLEARLQGVSFEVVGAGSSAGGNSNNSRCPARKRGASSKAISTSRRAADWSPCLWSNWARR